MTDEQIERDIEAAWEKGNYMENGPRYLHFAAGFRAGRDHYAAQLLKEQQEIRDRENASRRRFRELKKETKSYY